MTTTTASIQDLLDAQAEDRCRTEGWRMTTARLLQEGDYLLDEDLAVVSVREEEGSVHVITEDEGWYVFPQGRLLLVRF
jgi:hypothetical protein